LQAVEGAGAQISLPTWPCCRMDCFRGPHWAGRHAPGRGCEAWDASHLLNFAGVNGDGSKAASGGSRAIAICWGRHFTFISPRLYRGCRFRPAMVIKCSVS